MPADEAGSPPAAAAHGAPSSSRRRSPSHPRRAHARATSRTTRRKLADRAATRTRSAVVDGLGEARGRLDRTRLRGHGEDVRDPGPSPPRGRAGAARGERRGRADQARPDDGEPCRPRPAPYAPRISSATRNARSSDWRALSRGSQSGLVPVVELLLEHLLGAAEALGHVLAGDLEMNPARPCPDLPVRSEEPLDLAQHVVEAPRLVSRRRSRRCSRASDRTPRRPGSPLSRTARDERRQQLAARRSAPSRATSVSRPGMRSGLSRSQSATSSSGVVVGPTLAPIGLWTPERNSTCAPSSCRVRSPTQRKCAEQAYQSPVVESRAHERLLVVEEQRLVARPHVDLVDRALVAEVDPDRLHEPERAADLVRDHLVAPALERARDELLVPGVHLGQVGEAALRERTQQVERRDRLVVRLDHPLGIGHARFGRRLVGVDGVPAERGQLDARR